jgi:two-component system sensor histidine kinase ChiS
MSQKPWQAQDLLVTVQRGADHYWSEEEKRHLLQQLQEQNTRLETQNRELKRLDSLKSRFMSIASHELRTPLAIVSGSIELLQMMADNLTQKQAELINNALEGSHRLSGILTSVFDLLRIDAQKYSIRFSPHDLVPLIDKAVEEYAEAARQRRITISQKVTECIADVDPDSIATVFDKLLSNAVKFTPDGGKIEIIRQPDAGDMVHIAVVDNGIGIPRDELNRIFEKFYQLGDVELHSTSKTNFKGGGTGLGLAIVKGIVTLHQGKIYVTSEGERKGSQFHLHLPFRHDRPPLNVKSEAQAEFDFDLLGDDH